MRPLAPRERRMVALLILVAIFALGVLVIVAPVLDGFRARAERRAELMLRYDANRRLIASIPRMRRQAEQMRGALSDYAVSAPTPEIAGAAVEERLQRTIEANGGQVHATESTFDEQQLLHVKASAVMTLDATTRTLAQAQNEPPHLAVESLNIAADRAVVSGHLEPVDVVFEVSVPLARTARR